MKCQKYVTVLFVMAFILLYANAVIAQSTDQPASTVKLVFIHHSTGGHWLAEDNEYTYGELGKTLMNNNYYVSATNYCWGPIWEEQDENRGIGTYTNIIHWPEWFTGSDSSAVLSALYSETGQNFENCDGDSFGSWPRLSGDPGGENEIVMFKSCYPNSDLYGNPDDPAASSPNNWQFSVSNAKAVYNNLLTYFQTRRDKLFIVIAAPPMSETGYRMNDASTPASERAANARAFNNWLVNDWLDSYSHDNVAVFDYYNVLTSSGGSTDTNDAGQETGNHHRWHNGQVQHVQNDSNNFSSYPSFVGSDYADDHPTAAGHHKATAEFVPLLNYFYNKWKGTEPSVTKPSVSTGTAGSITTGSAILHGTVNPNGESTTFHFEYGPSASYGHSTTSTSAGSGTGSVSKSASITGLSTSTTYHYRIVATNDGGTSYGIDMTFTTEGTTVSKPTVATGSASSVTSGSATLSGTVNPNGDSTTYHFEYGHSTSYGHSTTSTSAGSGTGSVSKSASITGLSASTTYHYRIVATSEGGTTYGSDRTFTTNSGSSTTTGLVQPSDLEYQGAFRLPDVSGECNWTYSGHAMTCYPDGDPGGQDDGYPGSIFSVGNDAVCQYISEISIPEPVISSNKNLDELNTATTLQDFHDIRGGMFGDFQNLVIPRVGLEYLPPQGSQTTGKLHFCWAQHIQDFEASHGWCELTLSNPQPAGPWIIGNYTNYVTNDYIFGIPKEWADANLPGMYLATGRSREGPWSGRGPALFAYSPWNDGNPPGQNAVLSSVTPLLLYGIQEPDTPEISTGDSMEMNDYQDSDHWYGGAWLTAGSNAAVIFAGTKAVGKSWYGFANGVVWPYDCADHDPPTCPEYPAWPYDDRGFWADGYKGQIIFYNPDDLADVAIGTKQTWEPQPYASLDINQHLFDPEIDITRYKRDIIGSTGFDRTNGLLYIIEKLADGDKSIIHVWKVNAGSGETVKGDINKDGKLDLQDVVIVLKSMAGFAPGMNITHADINGDGRIGMEEAIYILQKISL
ncbi:MAG: hypothetical protein GY749_32725 [Desulfobacteraceae bacterium]|nr:hypothetical protein [Desulfobacteraceae bacterium]